MNKKILPHNHGDISKGLHHDMPDGKVFETISDVFKLFADAKRVQLFWILCHCEECVINLSAMMDMGSSAVSHHLKLLKAFGLIVSRREGKEVYYTAALTEKTKILHNMIEKASEVSCPAEKTSVNPQDYAANVHIVTEIHNFLVNDICTRYSTQELSKQFAINQTALKTTFKTVYGQPIATYMKEYRIKKAKELLVNSELSIANIAQAVGYENQSKFTQAFKDVTGILPKDYRKKQ